MHKLITLARDRLRGLVSLCSAPPNEQVDKMFAPLIDQCRHWPVIEIIKTAADQRKSLLGEIDHGRREVEPCIQPRFYRVLIGGRDVGEMICHQRTHMTGDEL